MGDGDSGSVLLPASLPPLVRDRPNPLPSKEKFRVADSVSERANGVVWSLAGIRDAAGGRLPV